MTVAELIEHLQAMCLPGDVVKAFDADSGRYEPVTGFLYGADSDAGDDSVIIQTDDNQ